MLPICTTRALRPPFTICMKFAKHNESQPYHDRAQGRLLIGVALSLLAHGLLLFLQFGLPGLGLPGLELSLRKRGVETPALQVRITNPQTQTAATAVPDQPVPIAAASLPPLLQTPAPTPALAQTPAPKPTPPQTPPLQIPPNPSIPDAAPPAAIVPPPLTTVPPAATGASFKLIDPLPVPPVPAPAISVSPAPAVAVQPRLARSAKAAPLRPARPRLAPVATSSKLIAVDKASEDGLVVPTGSEEPPVAGSSEPAPEPAIDTSEPIADMLDTGTNPNAEADAAREAQRLAQQLAEKKAEQQRKLAELEQQRKQAELEQQRKLAEAEARSKLVEQARHQAAQKIAAEQKRQEQLAQQEQTRKEQAALLEQRQKEELEQQERREQAALQARQQQEARRQSEVSERQQALAAARREQEREVALKAKQVAEQLAQTERERLQAEKQTRERAETEARQARALAQEQARAAAQEQARVAAQEQARVAAQEQARAAAQEQARAAAAEAQRAQADAQRAVERAQADALQRAARQAAAGNGDNTTGNVNRPATAVPAPAIPRQFLENSIASQLRNADFPAGRNRPGSPPPADDKSRRRSVFGSVERDVGVRLYVEGWRQKIERNGSLNYSRSASDRAQSDPVVTVVVRSDGSVEDITIHISSGRSDLDDAVRRIVRVNSPFAAFPPALAARYDVIEIRRVWRFDATLRLQEELQ